MRKTFFKTCFAMASTLIAINAFADVQPLNNASFQSITDALQQRTAVVAPKGLAAGLGVDTYIMVINYSETTIRTLFPGEPVKLVTRLTSTRFQRANFMGESYVDLQNEQGVSFFHQPVGYQDILSVYVSGGKYVVYDTK